MRASRFFLAAAAFASCIAAATQLTMANTAAQTPFGRFMHSSARTATASSLSDIYMGGYICIPYPYCSVTVAAIDPITATPTLLNNPFSSYERFYPATLAVGGSRLFTMYNDYGMVIAYDLGNPNPVSIFSDPGDLVVASTTDQLYVSHHYGINVYPRGATTPSRTITDGIEDVMAMAIGPTDGLYVSNGKNIVVYAGQKSSPSRTISAGIKNATFLTFDSRKQLLVYNDGSSSISIYPPQATEPSTVISKIAGVSWMTVGPTGTIYAFQNSVHTISEFDHEGMQLSRKITAIESPAVAVVDAQDQLYVLNAPIPIHPYAHIFTFKSGSTKPFQKLPVKTLVHQLVWTVGPPW